MPPFNSFGFPPHMHPRGMPPNPFTLTGLGHETGPACHAKYELAWGSDLAIGKPPPQAVLKCELPPATPDPGMIFRDLSSSRRPAFLSHHREMNLPMNSPMFIPFMTESPRPNPRSTIAPNFPGSQPSGAGNGGGVNVTLNLNVNG